MKIYFRNKAAKLKRYNHGNSCKRCPFFKILDNCPWHTSTPIVDCYGKGHWVDGESLDIFKV